MHHVSKSKLNYICEHSLKHKNSCILSYSSNPFDYYCLAPYGGPIIPGLVFGGFPDGQNTTESQYTLSKAVSLTFLVRNYHNKTKLKPAMEWEDRSVHCSINMIFMKVNIV